MKKFTAWLEDEPGFCGTIGAICIALGCIFVWQNTIVLIHEYLNAPTLSDVPTDFMLRYYYNEPFHLNTEVRTFVLTMAAAMPEEIVCRLLPIVVFFRNKRRDTWRWVAVALCVGPAFGLAHGVIPGLYLQNGIGLLLAALYLKCGGMNGRHLKALLSSWTAHFLLNFSLIQFLPHLWVWLYDLKAAPIK